MNRYLIVLFVIAMTLNQGCERDDICAETTPTTPNAIITFYDVSNVETLKSVTNLRIWGEGMENNPLPDVNIVTRDSIAIPLRTNMTSTTYVFHRDYSINNNGTPDDPDDDFTEGNPDIVTISYATEEVYVSRACGFKTIFRNFSIDVQDDGDLWILTFLNVTENLTIENENQAHINIRH